MGSHHRGPRRSIHRRQELKRVSETGTSAGGDLPLDDRRQRLQHREYPIVAEGVGEVRRYRVSKNYVRLCHDRFACGLHDHLDAILETVSRNERLTFHSAQHVRETSTFPTRQSCQRVLAHGVAGGAQMDDDCEFGLVQFGVLAVTDSDVLHVAAKRSNDSPERAAM